MPEPTKNRCRTSDLTDDDVTAALKRLGGRDPDLAREAEHVVGSLTWGEGPTVIRQAGLQEWLWYVVPTKYMTDEVGYMGHLAETAAALFDELGLHGYAAICRSDETAAVHAAFDRSDSAGREALRKATERSGIDPPDLDDFAWSSMMRMTEVDGRTEVERALEEAIYTGGMTVGARGWKATQAEVCRETLDGDHPDLPRQSWRTAIVTERIEQWVSAADRRSPALAQARSTLANRLLNPIDVPSPVSGPAREGVAPLVWLLERWGDEQPLTQAGYLKPAFVQSLQEDRPWEERFPSRRPAKTELDDHTLLDLREWLQRMGAVRRYKATLRLTPLGRSMAGDPVEAWRVATRHLADGDPWEAFVAETSLLHLVGQAEPVPDELVEVFVQDCAGEMGWQTRGDGTTHAPDRRDVSYALAQARNRWELCRLIDETGEWGSRHLALTEVGMAAALTHLRHVAAGPKHSPW